MSLSRYKLAHVMLLLDTGNLDVERNGVGGRVLDSFGSECGQVTTLTNAAVNLRGCIKFIKFLD